MTYSPQGHFTLDLLLFLEALHQEKCLSWSPKYLCKGPEVPRIIILLDAQSTTFISLNHVINNTVTITDL